MYVIRAMLIYARCLCRLSTLARCSRQDGFIRLEPYSLQLCLRGASSYGRNEGVLETVLGTVGTVLETVLETVVNYIGTVSFLF